MIKIENLSYSYNRGAQNALRDINATVHPGIHLLLGENGAGKTTLLRAMAGLIIPREGEVKINGESVSSRQPSALRRIFFLPDYMDIPARSIRAFARMHSRFYPNFSEETFTQNLVDFGLSGDEKLSQLSLGTRHKSLIAYVCALGVDVLLMDEPANGLDILAKRTLRQMLARCIGPDQTVIVSTHTVSDLRELYDGLMVLTRGELLISRPTVEIARKIECIASQVPPYQPIYAEEGPGIYYYIRENHSDEPGELNYQLLYTALMSDARQSLVSIINSK